MLVEKIELKVKDIEGEDGPIKQLEAANRTTESLYQLANNNVTVDDNMAMQKFTVSWHGDSFPSKVVDKKKIKGNPSGLILLKVTEDGSSCSLANPAWTFEKDTVKITDINGIIATCDYTATFLIM